MKEVVVRETKYLLSAKELAFMFQVSERTINNWTNLGIIDFVRGEKTAAGGKLYDLSHAIGTWKDYKANPEDYKHLRAGKSTGLPIDIIEVVKEFDLQFDNDDFDEYDD